MMYRVRANSHTLFLMLLVVLAPAGIRAFETAPWTVPASARKMKNPVPVTGEGVTAAQKLYQQSCASCHGPKGAGPAEEAESIPEKPANLSDVELIRAATDGELFWKISTGRPPMPGYENQYTATERWQLVNYIRQLARRYKYLGNRSRR
jgi:mono/diheme cytochrome c family protein